METLGEVIHKVKERCGTAPEEFGFDFDSKADTVYKLIMPKVDDIRSDELMQTCKSIGFELFRLLNPKLDPPRDELAFDLRTEIQGLGKHTCRDVGRTVRFVSMLHRRVNVYTVETGEVFTSRTSKTGSRSGTPGFAIARAKRCRQLGSQRHGVRCRPGSSRRVVPIPRAGGRLVRLVFVSGQCPRGGIVGRSLGKLRWPAVASARGVRGQLGGRLRKGQRPRRQKRR